ncbi:MAG: hypothetical protein MR400_08520 [Clostridiales bacterium]|nr:hypothetical protein [Clostridiales bacterium]
MPPKVRFDKDRVLDAALEIARREGIEGLNARKIAKIAGCSTQPLYRELGSMTAIRHATMQRASDYFINYMARESNYAADKPYLSAGVAYLRFARDESALFSMLFMRHRTADEVKNAAHDVTFEQNIRQVMRARGCDYETARDFHYQSYVFTHGLAVMIATGFMPYDEEALIAQLHRQFVALTLYFDPSREV